MPSPKPIKRNHLIKLHWLEIFGLSEFARAAGTIVGPVGHIFLIHRNIYPAHYPRAVQIRM
jgi:hypothetical protein